MLRFALLVPTIVFLAGCTAANNAPASNAATKATAVPPSIGATVKVGSLDLIVVAVRPTDTTQYNQFNAGDTAVDVDITNARGGTSSPYDFNPQLSLKLVDTSGVAHTPEVCAGCPNDIQDTQLVKGGHSTGSVYFKLAGATALEVDYAPAFSTNKVKVAVAP